MSLLVNAESTSPVAFAGIPAFHAVEAAKARTTSGADVALINIPSANLEKKHMTYSQWNSFPLASLLVWTSMPTISHGRETL